MNQVLGVRKIDDRTPIILLIYQHLTKHDAMEGLAWIHSVEERGYSGVPNIYGTQLERQLLLKLLSMNSKLLPPNFEPEKIDTEKNFRASFLIPIGPLPLKDFAGLNADRGCNLCGKPSSKRCSDCQSVSYCSQGISISQTNLVVLCVADIKKSKECQRDDWRDHKHTCRSLKGGQWRTVKFTSVPPGFGGVYMSQMNKHDEFGKLKEGNPSRVSNDDPPSNIYGERPFLMKMQTSPSNMMMYDRLRSCHAFLARDTQPAIYFELEEEMRGPRGGGFMGLKMYRWARRTGDWELSICLDRAPQQDIKW